MDFGTVTCNHLRAVAFVPLLAPFSAPWPRHKQGWSRPFFQLPPLTLAGALPSHPTGFLGGISIAQDEPENANRQMLL
jgi:hypothetical protein